MTISHCHTPNIKAVRLKVSEKKIFEDFFIKIYMLPWQPEYQSNVPKNNMPPVQQPNDAPYEIWSRLANWLSRYWYLKIFYYKSMETIDPRGMAKFDPRVLIGRIYIQDH